VNVSTLRSVDRWLGIPACFVLSWHRRLFERREPTQPVRRILFVKLAEQGSTVLAADAFDRAAARVGRENVFLLVFEENRFIADAMGVVPPGNVLTMDVSSYGRALSTGLSLLSRLRAIRADAAISLEFFARATAIFCYMSGAARRVGLFGHAGEGPYAGNLYTHRLVSNPYLHTSEAFSVMVEALDHAAFRFPAFDLVRPTVPDAQASHQPADDDLAAVRRLLSDATRGDAMPRLVLLNANCSDLLPLRRWDPARYVELARRLLAARPDLHVVFTGAPNEADAAQELVDEVVGAAAQGPSLARRCFSLAGKTTLPQLLALHFVSDVLVTNDSGPAHFATLTPIDVITLFGPETPALFGARTPRNHVLWAGTVCSPCVNAFNNRLSTCLDNVCMQRITVDQVLDATLTAYDRRARRA
jgi:ADP-heptose:LPS heptosyltransferase